MSTRHLIIRRLFTIVGVVAVLALGFGSIRAASAWTAASAPLTVAPVSVATLQTKLADEHARSEALIQHLRDLDARSVDLETALAQAQERIDGDAGHASDLEDQLAAANKKLTKLETAIAKAKKALAAQAAAPRVVKTTTSSAPKATYHEDEHEEDEHDEPEHDD
jgi:chromosome segregation ATPase